LEPLSTTNQFVILDFIYSYQIVGINIDHVLQIVLDCKTTVVWEAAVDNTPQQQHSSFVARTPSRLSLKRRSIIQYHPKHQPPDVYTPVEITPMVLPDVNHPTDSHITIPTSSVKRRLFDFGGTDNTLGTCFF
jgi:hypothetical protein